MRVLITRPLQYSEGLSHGIQELNGTPEVLPVVDIRPTPNKKALKESIKSLNSFNIVIFISRSAVHHSMGLIQAIWPELPDIVWIAQGPGTADALGAYDVPGVVFPMYPPYETESLLELPELVEEIQNKHIMIFRGNAGRPHLSEILRARGAVVQLVETYQRQLPKIRMRERLNFWQKHPLDVIIFTSVEGMMNLIKLVGSQAFEGLKKLPIVVVSRRMVKQAKELGFKRVVLAWSAEDAAIIQALKEIKLGSL